MFSLNVDAVIPLIDAALQEDVGAGDVTSHLLLPEAAQVTLIFRNREPLIVAGAALIQATYERLSVGAQVELHVADGEKVDAGTAMATVRGPARSLLTGERVALNLLQRACGVATLTNRFVSAVSGTGVAIRDTRKTMPGMRVLDKYAVRCGGGENHRMRLDDMILIKDNHIALNGSLTQAVEKAIAGNIDALPIEVECDTLAQVEEAVACDIDWILLDNMSPDMLRKAVAMRGERSVKMEASGGITLETIGEAARTGVDAISVGAITHSAVAVDIGLDIELDIRL